VVKLIIMANPSNLYAEKIFAEHPSALWALDDTANFISYISSSTQDLSTWGTT
jgi:signal transduction protein with GAF and PtsI domain